jgi:hypothetical protein
VVLIAGERGFIGDLRPSMMAFLRAWNDSGGQRPGLIQTAIELPAVEDPLGGVVAGIQGTPLQFASFDADLAERWRMNVPGGLPVALAVDRAGAMLYLFDRSGVWGRGSASGMWVDHSGKAGPIFEMLASYPASSFALTQRTGSGLFLAIGGNWVAQIDSMATAASAAPDWLKARPNVRLHMVRGGKGYAVLPVEGDAADCVQDVEVVSPAGQSCGVTRFRGAKGSCRTGPISVGYDGTVMQAAPDPDPAHHLWFGPATCYWRWWPGFYR